MIGFEPFPFDGKAHLLCHRQPNLMYLIIFAETSPLEISRHTEASIEASSMAFVAMPD